MKDVDSAAEILFSKALATDVNRLTKKSIVQSMALEIAIARNRNWTYQMIADVILDALGVRMSTRTVQKAYLTVAKDAKSEASRIAPIRRSRASGTPADTLQRPSARERILGDSARTRPVEPLQPPAVDARTAATRPGQARSKTREVSDMLKAKGIDFPAYPRLSEERVAEIKASTPFVSYQQELINEETKALHDAFDSQRETERQMKSDGAGQCIESPAGSAPQVRRDLNCGDIPMGESK